MDGTGRGRLTRSNREAGEGGGGKGRGLKRKRNGGESMQGKPRQR